MANTYCICISSPPDRERLVAEIFFGEAQWAEISQESSELMIEFYCRPDGEKWRVDFSSATAALEEAKQQLLSKS